MKNALIITRYLFITIILLFFSCQNDEQDTDPDTNYDVSGFWIVNETVTGNCSGSLQSENETEIFSVKQSGNNLSITVYPNGDVLNGKAEGSKITWEGTLPTTSGNIDIDFSGSLKNDSKIVGDADWDWYSNDYSCNGIMEANAQKVTGDDVDFTGQWEGTWTSDEYNIEGSFSANVNQEGTTLGGIISVPEIRMSGAVLKGFVHGNVVYFGDVDDKIKFVGLLQADASGAYSYNSLSDEGYWTAVRASSARSESIEIEEVIPVGAAINTLDDMAFDGTNFYILSGLKVFIISKEGAVIDSLETPGSYPNGLSYDGSHLLIGDNNWGSGKIFKLNTSTKSIFPLPENSSIEGVAFGDDCLWYADNQYGAPKVHKTKPDGEIIRSFDVSGKTIEGICFDGKNLWISYKNFSVFDNNKIMKSDLEGNELAIYDPPVDATGSLAYDGKYLWFSDEGSFFKMDTLGNLIKSFEAPVESERGKGLTIEGKHLWYTAVDHDGPETKSEVICIDTLGNFVSSFIAPGNNSVDITFDGSQLQLADRVTKKMYVLPLDGDYYMPFPDYDIRLLTSLGDNIFAFDFDNYIHLLNSEGVEVKNFVSPSAGPTGLYYDGNDLWYAENAPWDLSKIVKTDLNGTVLMEYYPVGNISTIRGLVKEGEYIWGLTHNNGFSLLKMKISE